MSIKCNAANNAAMNSIFTLHPGLEKHLTKAGTPWNTNCTTISLLVYWDQPD